MKSFTKQLKRTVHIPSSDRAINPVDWILYLDAQGVRLRRHGDRSRSWRLAWRSIIGLALVHNTREDPAPPSAALPVVTPSRKSRKPRKAVS